MRLGLPSILTSALLLMTAGTGFAFPHPHRGPTSPKMFRSRSSSKQVQRAAPVRKIDDERATQIQGALIKQGYMSGTPSGTWDSQTQAAMEKMQADNGWQTKLVPDSRAIIKLGLGPGAAGKPEADALPTTFGRADDAVPLPANQ
jgi:hypothetical protein